MPTKKTDVHRKNGFVLHGGGVFSSIHFRPTTEDDKEYKTTAKPVEYAGALSVLRLDCWISGNDSDIYLEFLGSKEI